MTDLYGIQEIPEIYQCTDYRDKYWGSCLTELFPEWKPYYEKL